MTGDPAAITADLKAWCRENGATLVSFGADSVTIESPEGKKESVGLDVRSLESITGRITSFLVVSGTLRLPERVHEVLAAGKCVFCYENLWDLDEQARHRILCGVLRPDNLQQYDSKNLVAHVAVKKKEQALSEAEIAQNYFQVTRDWCAQ